MRKFFFLLVILVSSSCYSQETTWQNLETEGEPLARHENALVAVGNKIILIGGRGEKPVDIYDVNKNNWSTGAQPPMEIHHFQAVSLDGLVYVLGAFTGSWPYETPISHIFIYDVEEDHWTIGPEIPPNRRRGAAGVVTYNDKIYMVNGIINGHTSGWVNWLDEYDPYTNTWKVLPDSPRARDHFQAAVIEDKMFIAGGRRSGSAETGFAGTVKETDVFDFNTQSWNVYADIPTPRAGTAALIYNNKYAVIGGESDTRESSHDEVELFNPDNNTWETLPALSTGRHGTQAVALDNKIIIGAGSGNRGGGPELNSFEILTSTPPGDFKILEIEAGKIEASAAQLSFTGNNNTQDVRLNNPGKKAIVITYLQVDKNSAFKIELPHELPLIIAPGSDLILQVTSVENKENSSATLFIKSLGKSQPLEITLSK